MKTSILLKLLILLIVIISFGGYIYSRQLSNRNTNNNLIQQIENWNLYQEITNQSEKESYFTLPDCSTNQEFRDYNLKASQGSVKVLMLNDTLPLVLTPNYNNWSNEKFLSFINDSTAICSAGGIYPLKAYTDELFWRGGCSTGAIPQGGEQVGSDFQKCLKAEQVVNDYFSVQ